MPEGYWAPRVTVAAVIERDSRFLVVEERVDGERVLNQPAGHLEPGESLVDAVVRETREETGHVFTPQHLVGIYQWRRPKTDSTFLRFTFAGTVRALEPRPPLDDEIVALHWLTAAELHGVTTLRSPLVLRSIEDHAVGRHFPLEALQQL